MKAPIQRYGFFLLISFASFILVTAGFEIWASTNLHGETLAHALANVRDSFDSLDGVLFTYAPFLVVALISASLARVSWSRAIGLFVFCVAIFAAMYYAAYMKSEEYMLQRKWTAAALAVGLVPLNTWPVLLLAFVARLVLGRFHVPAKA